MRKLKKEEFEKIVEEGISAIPEKFLRKLDNVAIVIEDECLSRANCEMLNFVKADGDTDYLS